MRIVEPSFEVYWRMTGAVTIHRLRKGVAE